MGLWSSKQSRDVNVNRREAEVMITEDAISTVLKSLEPQNIGKPKQEKPADDSNNSNNNSSNSKQPVNSDNSDIRIAGYERNLADSFEKASKEVDELFRQRYQTLPVCTDLQSQVGKCYKENPRLPLKCSDIVNQYIKCVESERKRLTSNFKL